MNEKRVQELLQIEKQAQAILHSAVQEAEQLPAQAEREAQQLIETARESARQEAQGIVQRAEAEDPTADVMAKMQEKIVASQSLSAKNLDRAVAYVLRRVTGEE